MKRGSGLIGFASVTAPAILNVAVTALLGVLTARFLGPAGQGALTTIVTIGAILSVVVTLGTGVSLRLRSHPHPDRGDLSAFLGVSLVMAGLSAVIAPATSLVFDLDAVGTEELVLTAIVAALLVLARQSSDLLQAYGRAGRSILFLALGVVFQCALFGFAVVSGHATLRAALISAAAGAAVQVALGLWNLSDQVLPRPSLPRSTVGSLIRMGAPAVGYTMGLMVVQRLDRLVIVAVLGTASAGIYAVAATMAEASRITSSAVGQLLFVQTAAAGSVTTTTRRTYRLALAVQVGVVIVGWFVAPFLVPLLFGDAYAGAVPVAQILLVAEMFMGLALMDGRVLMGLRRVALVAWMTAALVLLAVPTYLLFVNGQALPGAARASLVLYLVYAVVLIAGRRKAERKVSKVAVPV